MGLWALGRSSARIGPFEPTAGHFRSILSILIVFTLLKIPSLSTSLILKRIPLFYSRSEYIDQSIKLFLNSLIVSGNKDTAIYYAKVFKKQFPQMDVDKKIMDLINMNEQEGGASKDAGGVDVVGSIKDIFNKVKEEITSPIPEGKYSIQIGAFGNKKNAYNQRDLLIAAGHKARVDELSHRNLYAVRVGYYASKEEAKEDLNKVNSIIGTKAIIFEVD